MFEPMLRNKINNKMYILTDEFQAEGCTGCGFQYDYIGCANALVDTPEHGCGGGTIWVEVVIDFSLMRKD
jgi:hypothetical protein